MKKSGKFTVVIGQKQAMIKNRNMPSMPVCASSFHGVGLTYKEALDIIDSSECGQNGHATGREFCNPDNGFWWFDMGMPDENNCVASCVIDMKTKTVEADTRCLPIPEHKILPAPSVVTYEAD
jgi:hypothetical protein